MRKRIIILGSTGSIGTQALQVAGEFRDRFEVVGLATLGRLDLIVEQARAFAPKAVAISDPQLAEQARGLIDLHQTTILSGAEPMLALIADYECDLVVAATSGSVGLAPTLMAIELERDIALANKETLVKAGRLVMTMAERRGVDILPIDSEHNAIFQCLAGHGRDAIRRILITGSGGPFLDRTGERLEHASVAEALHHPRWQMGPKITVDSATLMNKGFEIIEGHYLFGVPIDRIDVIIHPESIVHSMVEFVDGSILAQLGVTDMRLPILNCLAWPERLKNTITRLDLCEIGQLTFREPDLDRFPMLGYAREAVQAGGTMPAVLNAANEVAVRGFLDGRIAFGEIARTVRRVMAQHQVVPDPTLDRIEEADQWARIRAEEYALAAHA
jgi:1-deoxy-D-xylulose-5-phosphate reductoisomerase